MFSKGIHLARIRLQYIHVGKGNRLLTVAHTQTAGRAMQSYRGTMHELSIAQSLIELANECAAEHGAARVDKLNVRIGRLAGVVESALLFSFELAAAETPCAGAKLAIVTEPVRAMCPQCQKAKQLIDWYSFVCPDCGHPTAELLSGQELELVSIEIDMEEEKACDSPSFGSSNENT